MPVKVSTDLHSLIAHHWGITKLRPLQESAMQAVLEGRDSMVVLPTGGGKSLCYQAPAILKSDTTVVVSPLISLMKDQVDGLKSCGINAMQLNSSLSPAERSACIKDIRTGSVRLLFVSPERLLQSELCELLKEIDVRTFAIDEAHCVSHWGHDFRPEYRQLARLKEYFPQASVHAYTATATEQVRRDIIEQLGLRRPEILIGNFDRPNLTYLITPRRETTRQTIEVIKRHENDGGIVYCLRRADVDSLAADLCKQGIKAMPYHAGLSSEQRTETQNAFTSEQCDVVVATVAFGMGIDRSNVRYVIHAGLPKSIEHYQQETGRAGRDGLDAECVLFYSGADFFTWKSLIERSAKEANVEQSVVQNSIKQLQDMDEYCRAAACRHALLVKHFGQLMDLHSCSACDICLGYTVSVPDAHIVAQKIVSCVARVKDRFGISYIAAILRGENTQNIRNRGHHQLSTFGLLKGHTAADIRDWIYQLISQGALQQENIDIEEGRSIQVVNLNSFSWEIMRGQKQARLVQPVRPSKEEQSTKSKSKADALNDADRELFEALRGLRKQLAQERSVPPYIIFADATLMELARSKPDSLGKLRQIYGVGDTKLKDFGQRFLDVIKEAKAN